MERFGRGHGTWFSRVTIASTRICGVADLVARIRTENPLDRERKARSRYQEFPAIHGDRSLQQNLNEVRLYEKDLNQIGGDDPSGSDETQPIISPLPIFDGSLATRDFAAAMCSAFLRNHLRVQ